jgi:hypothetical protein
VRDAMNTVHFTAGGASPSYGGFCRGFGLSVTASMLFFAFLAWQLGALVRTAPRTAAYLGWGLCAPQALSFGLSCIYFAVAPAIFSLAVAACLAFPAWSAEPRGRAEQAAHAH